MPDDRQELLAQLFATLTGRENLTLSLHNALSTKIMFYTKRPHLTVDYKTRPM
jgi:hypothetical protein